MCRLTLKLNGVVMGMFVPDSQGRVNLGRPGQADAVVLEVP
jgi:hypothetical protein